jgi:hypothetical protein
MGGFKIKNGRLLSARNRFGIEELPQHHFAHRPSNHHVYIISHSNCDTIITAHRVGSSHLNRVQ